MTCHLPAPQIFAYARTRPSLSLQPLLAVRRFATRISVIEAEFAGQELSEFWQEILELSLAIATLSVAALESCANEIFFDGEALSRLPNYPNLSAELKDIDGRSILEKFSLGLELHAGEKLDRGTSRVQNVDVLIALRNTVVHFRSEWSDAQQDHKALSKRLKYRFKGSPFLPNEPLFPYAWASGSYADWTIRSVVQFLDLFYVKVGISNPLDPFRQRILGPAGIAA